MFILWFDCGYASQLVASLDLDLLLLLVVILVIGCHIDTCSRNLNFIDIRFGVIEFKTYFPSNSLRGYNQFLYLLYWLGIQHISISDPDRQLPSKNVFMLNSSSFWPYRFYSESNIIISFSNCSSVKKRHLSNIIISLSNLLYLFLRRYRWFEPCIVYQVRRQQVSVNSNLISIWNWNWEYCIGSLIDSFLPKKHIGFFLWYITFTILL